MQYLSLPIVLLLLCGGAAHADSFAQTKAKAQSGNPEAQYQLAKMYEGGTGVERSVETALDWYKQAAGHGHSQSMLRLAVLYYNGDVLGNTIKADPQEAWLWFTFAAAYGQAQAATDAERVGRELRPATLRDLKLRAAKALVDGNEVPANVGRGVELYRAAAEDGSADAAERLAALYMGGARVPRDTAQASAWYERAARAGSVRAMTALAKIAESDSPPDLARAFELYRKAALKSDTKSMYRVGEMYAAGTGVSRNLVSAYSWFTVAGDFDFVEGRAAARELEVRLTRDQIERARIEVHSIIASLEPTTRE
jgi:hypothetical protein